VYFAVYLLCMSQKHIHRRSGKQGPTEAALAAGPPEPVGKTRAGVWGLGLGEDLGEADEHLFEGFDLGAGEDGLEGGAAFGAEGPEVEAVPLVGGAGFEVEEGAGGRVVPDIRRNDLLAGVVIGDGVEDGVEGVAVAGDGIFEEAAVQEAPRLVGWNARLMGKRQDPPPNEAFFRQTARPAAGKLREGWG
jgi:hypothetical protein